MSASSERVCLECTAPLGPGRKKFCTTQCRVRDNDKRKARRKPCTGCGGDKGYGTQGGRYCQACRERLGPIWQQMERERGAVKNDRKRRLEGRPKRTVKVREDGFIRCAGCCEYLTPARYRKYTGKPPARCTACSRQYHHEYGLKQKYGIDSVEYHRMYEMQDGRCAICRNRPVRARLAVDHDHETGAVRGLLCKRCNHDLLGAAHDSIALLERAISYLESPPAITGVPVLIHEDYTFKKGNKS